MASHNPPVTYPETPPHASGMLDVGDGNAMYWEACGNPDGKPAVVLHGGPGSGAAAFFMRFFDPAAYRIILFDQRQCGRSTPHASDFATNLATNTTHHLVADIERLREHIDIERWLVYGASWGVTLGLLYAETHPERVSATVFSGVTTTRPEEIDWLYRGGLAPQLPAQWQRFTAHIRGHEREADPVAAYHALLSDPSPAAREAAALEWCYWESASIAPGAPPLSPRFEDPAFRMAFARIVTHYFHHNAWLEPGQLLRDAHRLAGIPAILVHGESDLQARLNIAQDVHTAWPGSELRIVPNQGHAATAPTMAEAITRALDDFRDA